MFNFLHFHLLSLFSDLKQTNQIILQRSPFERVRCALVVLVELIMSFTFFFWKVSFFTPDQEKAL